MLKAVGVQLELSPLCRVPSAALDRRLALAAQPLLMLRVCHALEVQIILQPATQDHVRHVLLVLLASPEPLHAMLPPTLFAPPAQQENTAQALQPTQ